MRRKTLLGFAKSAVWRVLPVLFVVAGVLVSGQKAQAQSLVQGVVLDAQNEAVGKAQVWLRGSQDTVVTGPNGKFAIDLKKANEGQLMVQAEGYVTTNKLISKGTGNVRITLKPDLRYNKSVTIQAGSAAREQQLYAEKIDVQAVKDIGASNVTEATVLMPGVRSQSNCNVCGTTEIRINGMDGPYTMVSIDGMPIVSGLGSVYGLMGIPVSIINNLELVRGPASISYGSESLAGMLNVNTIDPVVAPKYGFRIQGKSYGEVNADLGLGTKAGKWVGFTNVSLTKMSNRIDRNRDGFMDIPLTDRAVLFSKWKRGDLQLATRLIAEHRQGGQMDFSHNVRGSDMVYGESIYTYRGELLGRYNVQQTENRKRYLSFSHSSHLQNSYYGTSLFDAEQHISFAQYMDEGKLYGGPWNRTFGATMKLQVQNDNILKGAGANPVQAIGGVLAQLGYNAGKRWEGVGGLRYDYSSLNGSIWTPRLAARYEVAEGHKVRVSSGTGFRVVNLSTEDHLALSGARTLVISEELKPEKSANVTAGYDGMLVLKKGFVKWKLEGYYTYFSNRIIADFGQSNDAIVYRNLDGYAISRGGHLQIDADFNLPIDINGGLSLVDVYQMRRTDGGGTMERVDQVYAPKWSANYNIGLPLWKERVKLSIYGQYIGSMPMPVLENDYRPANSPDYMLHNMQVAFEVKKYQIQIGVENLLDYFPSIDPLMRAFDPFDKTVGVDNPNGYTFDTTYNYAPLMGRRLYLGISRNF